MEPHTDDPTGAPSLILRPYGTGDAAATLEVFREAVAVTAAADYTPRQITAWLGDAARERETPEFLDLWDRARRAATTVVAEVAGQVVGFAGLTGSGHVDMLFVGPRHGGRGVATSLLDDLLRTAQRRGAAEATAEVSLTARPFFEASGFRIAAEQHPVRDGIRLTNHRMCRPLGDTPRP